MSLARKAASFQLICQNWVNRSVRTLPIQVLRSLVEPLFSRLIVAHCRCFLVSLLGIRERRRQIERGETLSIPLDYLPRCDGGTDNIERSPGALTMRFCGRRGIHRSINYRQVDREECCSISNCDF